MTRFRLSAVIFDYGNVLSAHQGSREIQAMADIFSINVDLFRQAYWKFRLAYDAAAFDSRAYWSKVAAAASVDLAESQIPTLVEIDSRSWSYPARDIPQWARQLHREGVRTGLLSNMPAPVRDYIAHCDWLPPFHHLTFSCDLRIAKPAPDIYRDSIRGLGLDATEILFLDDRPENVRAAEALGLHGIVYQSAGQAAAELRQRFDIPVPLIATLEGGDEKDQ